MSNSPSHDDLAARAVPIPIGAHLGGDHVNRFYRRISDGEIPLAPPSPTGNRRVYLRDIEALSGGIKITEERLAAAVQRFALECEQRNRRQSAALRRTTVEQSA
jgi:hypothetical protein